MTENALVGARIAGATETEAVAMLATMMLFSSDAFRLLLRRVAAEKALPLVPMTPNAETIDAMRAVRRGDSAIAGEPASPIANPNAGG